jgi:hypothetical protein
MTESEMVPASEIESRLAVRSHRHSILERPKPARLLTLVDEQVLSRMIGGPAVMHRQLGHLAKAGQRDNISVRVIPNSGAHAGANGAFVLLKRLSGHKVVPLENLTSSLFLEEPEEIEAYEKAIRILVRRALSERESVEVITKLARQWEQG